MMGGYRKRLKAYASTLHGDGIAGGLSSFEAYADFAEHCLNSAIPVIRCMAGVRRIRMWKRP